MSIWCSGNTVGKDAWAEEGEPQRGVVRAYRDGFSNHYPDDTDPEASVDLADISPWCVPGHRDSDCETCGGDHDHPETGGWLRLTVDSPNALTWWPLRVGALLDRTVPLPRPEPLHGSVVLDEAAVRALRDDLDAWLAQPKLTPTQPTQPVTAGAEREAR